MESHFVAFEGLEPLLLVILARFLKLLLPTAL